MQSRKGESFQMKTTYQTRIPLSREEITKVKTRALRKGVWYKVLNRIERACIDLVIRVVERVRSFSLKRALSSILSKLEVALESPVQRLMREIGVNIVSELSRIAQQWGNKSAFLWVKDVRFIQFLTLTRINATL